jgi:acetylornithine deacetylase
MSTLPHFQDQLAQLVALPSVSSTSKQWDMGNRKVVDLLATWLADLGFTIELIALPENPDKANLIATRGTGPGGLVLAGHTDTVPYDDNQWQHDPFKLIERNQKLYGLGATDMKGFFPVALAAIQQFSDCDFQQPLIVLATADEESSMSGARQLAALGKPKARYAVIGEPTSLKPVRMHKGIMMEAIRIQGAAGHSSNPDLGNSALEAMHEVMADLLNFRRELQAKHQHSGFDVAVPTLNLGHIHGGDNPNRICGQCELHFDLRPVPGMRNADLRKLIGKRLQPIIEKTHTNIQMRSLIGGVDPFEQLADSPLVKAAEKLSGATAESVGFATEAPFMQQLGMETIVFGPGSIDQAHQPDEFIDMKQIQPGINAIAALIHQFCVQAETR